MKNQGKFISVRSIFGDNIEKLMMDTNLFHIEEKKYIWKFPFPVVVVIATKRNIDNPFVYEEIDHVDVTPASRNYGPWLPWFLALFTSTAILIIASYVTWLEWNHMTFPSQFPPNGYSRLNTFFIAQTLIWGGYGKNFKIFKEIVKNQKNY